MEEFIRKLPKVELHLHLDGSVRVETANFLLGRDVTTEMVCDESISNLNDYLDKFSLPLSLMQNKENLEEIAEELAEDLKQENVLYAEIRFAPLLHLEEGLTPEEVIDSILRGLKKVDIKTNLILCMMRNASFEDNKRVIDLAEKYLNKGVCAIDLAGAEALYKTADFADLFAIASSKNIPFTIHAGEADGISSIESALDFKTKRIGHGVRCLESKDTIFRLKKEKVTLEVCPTSNLNTCIISKYEEHPIKKIMDLGIKVTINTDNRTVSNITLSEEYEKLITYHNFTKKDFLACNINALEASFLNDNEKTALIKLLKDKYNEIK